MDKLECILYINVVTRDRSKNESIIFSMRFEKSNIISKRYAPLAISTYVYTNTHSKTRRLTPRNYTHIYIIYIILCSERRYAQLQQSYLRIQTYYIYMHILQDYSHAHQIVLNYNTLLCLQKWKFTEKRLFLAVFRDIHHSFVCAFMCIVLQ